MTGASRERRHSSIRPSDGLRLAFAGVGSRPLRAVLSALGIAIGIGAMLAVVGISASSRAGVAEQLSRLGTNMFRVEPGTTFFGKEAPLPPDTVGKVRLIDGVESASGFGIVNDVNVYRSHLVDPAASGGIQIAAADLQLLEVTAADLRSGTWLNAATQGLPTVVLGSTAAERLGVVEPGGRVWLGGRYFIVLGILNPVPLAPELDASALVGVEIAHAELGWKENPTVVYTRASEQSIDSVRSLLPPTVNPQSPGELKISRPSDALAAKTAIDEAFTGLLVGVGGIALLVGGIGVANTMIISVIERRREIGLRRALGATRRHIRIQFVSEALVLSALGGTLGAVLGWLVTAVIAPLNGWPVSIPVSAVGFGLGATLLIGGAAGLYPAMRAAATPPTTALSG